MQDNLKELKSGYEILSAFLLLGIVKERFDPAAGRHGFGYDLDANPVPELVYPLGAAAARTPQAIARLKGFLDLQASIDSEESSDLKRFMSALQPDQVKPMIEELGLFGNWAHGTHVAGIALAGKPFARLVVGHDALFAAFKSVSEILFVAAAVTAPTTSSLTNSSPPRSSFPT